MRKQGLDLSGPEEQVVRKRLRRVALIAETQVSPRRRMINGVARYIREHDPWAIYLKPFGADKSLDRWLQSWQGDGIIAAVTDSEIDLLQHHNLPVVDLIGIHRREGVPLVRTNDRAVGRVGAEHLLDRGFRHFGFVVYPEHTWSTRRCDAFVERLSEEGLNCSVRAIPFPRSGAGGPDLWENQQKMLCQWLESLPKPVGVMCSTDLLAQQLLEACLRSELNVPEQIAVLGADNDEPICNICYPSLSSVIINDEQRGYMAAAVLDRMMNGEAPPKDVVWVDPIGVFSRASTDILAVEDELVATSLRFVREHACEQISVDDVVRQVPVSRSVLERRFRRIIGRSINNEILRIRLNTAVQLLCETDLAIKVIAMKSGFRSTSYMSAVFREKLNRTPGSYRGEEKSHRSSRSKVTARTTRGLEF